jgi:hypothetical protein
MTERPGRQGEWSTEWPFDGVAPRQLLASVGRLAGVGVWVYDPSTGTVQWSHRAKQLHGFARDDRMSLGDAVDQYGAEDGERVLELLDRAAEEDEPFDAVVSLVGNGTTDRAVRVRCEPQAEGDAVQLLHGTVRDVTEEQRREQRIRILRTTSQQLKEAQTREDVATVLADAAKNILGLVNTAVRLVDERSRLLEAVVVTEECVERAGERPDYPVDGDSAAARVFRSGEPERFADMRQVDDWERGELVSGLCVPIGDHGVLSAGDIVTDAFGEADLAAAALLGDVGAEALTRIGWARRSRAI